MLDLITLINDSASTNSPICRYVATEKGLAYIRCHHTNRLSITFRVVTAHQPGSGFLSDIMKYLATNHSGCHVKFEYVIHKRLAQGLQKRGFTITRPARYPDMETHLTCW